MLSGWAGGKVRAAEFIMGGKSSAAAFGGEWIIFHFLFAMYSIRLALILGIIYTRKMAKLLSPVRHFGRCRRK